VRPFVRETGIAAPLPRNNIDTDQIVPGHFLKRDRALGYGPVLFHNLRFDAQGRERPDFVLNQSPWRNATILVTGANFACGSSREAAVYAIADYGIRALIAPSFGDIFYNNCLKNGVLPVRLDAAVVEHINQALLASAIREITVDLQTCEVHLPDGTHHAFTIDAFWRECLMQGVDDLDLTLRHMDAIERFETAYAQTYPWVCVVHATEQHGEQNGRQNVQHGAA